MTEAGPASEHRQVVSACHSTPASDTLVQIDHSCDLLSDRQQSSPTVRWVLPGRSLGTLRSDHGLDTGADRPRHPPQQRAWDGEAGSLHLNRPGHFIREGVVLRTTDIN
eukprot:TRINITY_DN6468_c1_g1_i1.p2 TRINITY_DN6468_c1_g1~~TRINITY_DN6468_c1_g1_i1.p2  ORF type:complete len:109 (-),score=1.68 TRINITY_DN6468_c1_g1_i1:69-395(-)